MKRFLAILLLLATASTQAASSDGEIQAHALENGNDASIRGDLLAYSFQGTGSPGFEAQLTLEATRILVEVDEAETPATVGGFGVGREQRTLQFEGDRIVGTSTDPGLKIWAKPHEAPIRFTGVGQRVQASPESSANEPDYQLNHTAQTVDVAGSIEWAAKDAHAATLDGSVYFSDRQFPFRLYDGDEIVYEFVGDTVPEENAPGVRSGQVVRAAHVWAADATLRIESTKAHQTRAFLAAESVEAVGPWTLIDASGVLRQASERITLNGDHDLDPYSRLHAFNVEGSRMALSIESTKVDVNGPQDSLTPPQGPDLTPESTLAAPDNGTWPPWLAAIAVAFIGLGGLLGVRANPRFKSIKRALDRENYGYVARKAPRFLSEPTLAPQASLMQGISLVALHRFDDACEFLQSLKPSQRMDDATWYYLMATARAQQGKKSEASQHVQRCLEASPEYIVEVTDNVVLRDLVMHPTRESGPGSLEGYQ